MRLRHERRIRKQLRTLYSRVWALARTVSKLEGRGHSLTEALRAVLLDPAHGYSERAAAGKLLAIARDEAAVPALLALFFEQEEKDELRVTALTLETVNDSRTVAPLIRALQEDANPRSPACCGAGFGLDAPGELGDGSGTGAMPCGSHAAPAGA